MSFQAMSWAVECQTENYAQKLILLMLANHCNSHTGQCNPSHKLLSKECSMPDSTLRKGIQALADQGFIRIEKRFNEGVQLPNQYHLNITPHVLTEHTPCSGVTHPPVLGEQQNQEVKPVIKPISNTDGAKRKTKITLQQFLDECKEKNERPLKDYKGLWKYCEDVKITEEMIALAWRVFRTKYTSETHGHKEQKDWRATFLNYIKGNYLKLWWLDSDENYKLTTAGMQAKMEHGESR